ncbi:MAG: hypothetical protein WCI22_07625 [Actinomycetota bacterium]
MDADLFAPNASLSPRPAWQVIDAARRQYVTGELLLDTNPPARIYLRDGQVYFAERTTDGALGVRLLVEGVITREQMHKGTVQVSGVEHIGRLFERDTGVDRDAVHLCVELMTDDVLTSVAEEMVHHVRMAMYKRHPSGIDRWLPTRVEVITHVVSSPQYADPDVTITAGEPPRPTIHLSPGPLDEQSAEMTTPQTVAAPPPVVAGPVVAEVPARPAPAPTMAPLASVVPPSAQYMFQSVQASDMPTGILPVVDPMLDGHPAPAGDIAAADNGISLAPEAMHAIMSTGIADEVAEAVRRALAAIDASPPSADDPRN